MSELVVSKRTYVFVWASLLMLLGLTVAVSYIHLGWFNATAAVSIAIMKALIIILYFMHARYSPKLVWIFVGAGFLWLGFLFLFTIEDYATRAYLPSPTVWLP
jgi:cytochrome c oxidase subunit IV